MMFDNFKVCDGNGLIIMLVGFSKGCVVLN